MKRFLIVGLLTGIAFLLVQCGKQSTPPDESDATNSITIETSETSSSTHAGSSVFWAEYRCLENATDSTCDLRFLEIGNADGMLYQLFFDSTDVNSETSPILLSGNGYDLAVTIKSDEKNKDGSSGTGGKRLLTLTIQPMQIPHLPYPPCLSTASLSQSLVTKPYSLDSVRVVRDDLLAWITYKSGNSAPQFSLIAWYPGVASTGDTTNCYLRFAASDTSGPLVKARLGFNLAPLASVIGQKTPCECVSTLRVLRPQNNWHSGFEVTIFERTVPTANLEPPLSPIPFTEGSYWVYQVKKSGYAGQCDSCIDSLSVANLAREGCVTRIRMNRRFAFLTRDLDYCGGELYLAGQLFEFPVEPFDDTATVPAGCFQNCFVISSAYVEAAWVSSTTTVSEGVGIVRYIYSAVSPHYGTLSSYKAELIRYHIASD